MKHLRVFTIKKFFFSNISAREITYLSFEIFRPFQKCYLCRIPFGVIHVHIPIGCPGQAKRHLIIFYYSLLIENFAPSRN